MSVSYTKVVLSSVNYYLSKKFQVISGSLLTKTHYSSTVRLTRDSLHCTQSSDLCTQFGNYERFSPKKCLLMKKITRYQYEKQRKPLYTESQLKQYVSVK